MAQAAWYAQSERKDWCTPEDELARVRQLGRAGRIDFDPCSNPGSLVRARVECQLERGEDGFARRWRGRGLVSEGQEGRIDPGQRRPAFLGRRRLRRSRGRRQDGRY